MPNTIVGAGGVAMNKTETTGNTHTHPCPSGIVILVEQQTYIHKVQLTLDRHGNCVGQLS